MGVGKGENIYFLTHLYMLVTKDVMGVTLWVMTGQKCHGLDNRNNQ